MLANLNPAPERYRLELMSRLRSRLCSRSFVFSTVSANSLIWLLFAITAFRRPACSVWISAVSCCSLSMLLVIMMDYVSRFSGPSSMKSCSTRSSRQRSRYAQEPGGCKIPPRNFQARQPRQQAATVTQLLLSKKVESSEE